MDKKGFSLIELLATVMLLGILSVSGVMAVSRAIVNSQNKTYKNYENQMIGAAKNYLTTHTDEIVIGNNMKLTLNTLQEGGYIESLVDPKSKHNCDANKSYVLVKSNQNSGDFNIDFDYTACLCCTDSSYRTFESKKDSKITDKDIKGYNKNNCDVCWN